MSAKFGIRSSAIGISLEMNGIYDKYRAQKYLVVIVQYFRVSLIVRGLFCSPALSHYNPDISNLRSINQVAKPLFRALYRILYTKY